VPRPFRGASISVANGVLGMDSIGIL
jgi:hypothetical protein